VNLEGRLQTASRFRVWIQPNDLGLLKIYYKYSGRVGRCADAKELSDKAIRLAVIAHVRHAETPYDELLGKGADRHEARDIVLTIIDKTLLEWGSF
jgi:hypothetical protein